MLALSRWHFSCSGCLASALPPNPRRPTLPSRSTAAAAEGSEIKHFTRWKNRKGKHRKRPGFFHRMLAERLVAGPIVALRPEHDRALGTLYPVATCWTRSRRGCLAAW